MKAASPKNSINWKDLIISALAASCTAAIGVAGQMAQVYLKDGSSFYMDNATLVVIIKNSVFSGLSAGLTYLMIAFKMGKKTEEN